MLQYGCELHAVVGRLVEPSVVCRGWIISTIIMLGSSVQLAHARMAFVCSGYSAWERWTSIFDEVGSMARRAESGAGEKASGQIRDPSKKPILEKH